MHGIVSELPEPFCQIVEDIWDELERGCGLTGIRATPIPHFSWHVAQQYDIEKSAEIIKNLAAQTSPFRVRTAGVSIFTGESPIIHIPIIRTSEISSLHERIWEAIQPAAIDTEESYNSEHWVPHISLAYPDVTRDNLNCAMQILAFRDFKWYFNINSISLIGGHVDHEAERYYRIRFGNNISGGHQ